MNRLLTILVLLYFSTKAYSQDYIPFPKDSASWSVFRNTCGFDESGIYDCSCESKHYKLYGDTTIDSLLYSRLIEHPFYDSIFDYNNAKAIAYVREDSLKKVWIRNVNDSFDLIKYDFNLEVGDTFCFGNSNQNCQEVTEVDSILTKDSLYRKRIHFTYPIDEYWIEGIGSETSWFSHNYVGGTINSNLSCFSIKDSSIYGFQNCYCETPNGITEKQNLKSEFKIYPNPSRNKFIIEFEFNTLRKIVISDVFGKEVFTLTTEKSVIELSTHLMKRGIYFIKTSDKYDSYKKLIIEK